MTSRVPRLNASGGCEGVTSYYGELLVEEVSDCVVRVTNTAFQRQLAWLRLQHEHLISQHY